MKGALFAGSTVFALGALVPLVALAWLVIAVAIVGVSGSILARTGGLEPATFGTCVAAAIVLDAVLLLAIIAASIARRVPDDAGHGPAGFFLRRPLISTAAGLLLALAAVTAAGWRRSPYFPYPLATIIVLANAYFFGLITVLYTGRVVDMLWAPLKAWSLASAYRTGLLTATLVLTGAAGYALRKSDLPRDSVRQLGAGLELAPLQQATGFTDIQLAGLCIAASEIAPELVRSASAPGCRLPEGGGAAGEQSGSKSISGGSDCFTSLHSEMAAARGILIYKLRVPEADAEDIAMDALLKTCTHTPPPRNLRSYFFQVVRNEGVRSIVLARRALPCDHVDEHAPALCTSDPPEHREAELELVWTYARCVLDDQAADVLRSRLVDQLDFRQIGERWGLRTNQAHDIFHNAIKKLRRSLNHCFQ